MKKISLFIVTLLLGVAMYGQGIAVQGIARDAQKSAITNEQKQFTFTISGATSLYQEKQNITTDAFGVFSHIVSTGTQSSTKNFDELNFAEKLTLIVSVDGVGEVYRKPFSYTPYAYYGTNGVTVGTIVAYMGSLPPKGWLLCDGKPVPNKPKYKKLRTILGTSATGTVITPDLRGRFLRGAGVGKGLLNKILIARIGQTQYDDVGKHNHGKGGLKISKAGKHSHTIQYVALEGKGQKGGSNFFWKNANGNTAHTTRESGEHTHAITGRTGETGGVETRPYSYGVNYIIKY